MIINNLKIEVFSEFTVQNDDKRKAPTQHRDLVATVNVDHCTDSMHVDALVEAIKDCFEFDAVAIDVSFTTENI